MRKQAKSTLPEDFQPIYNDEGKLSQSPEAYTAITIVKLAPGEYILRQVDIVNGKVYNVIDSKMNAKSVVFEYFKMAAADLLYKGI